MPSECGPDAGMLSVARLSRDVRRYLAENDAHFAFRWVCQAICDFRALADDADRERFLAGEPDTGDVRWDALIAGVAEREARRAGLSPPRWTAETRYILDQWWFLSPTDSLRAYSLLHTPAELAIRNVYVDERSLESV